MAVSFFVWSLFCNAVLSAFLLLQSSGCGKELPNADSEGGGVRTPPGKSQKYRVLSNTGSPGYQASIQCWAINGPLVKRYYLAAF